jgi:hypothetical protein
VWALFHASSGRNSAEEAIDRTIDLEGRKNRGLISLMRRHEYNLNEDQMPKVEKYLDLAVFVALE